MIVESTTGSWGSEEEKERKNRIKLSLAAYAYEYSEDLLMTDGDYDQLALAIRPEMDTGNKVLDKFFRTDFSPDTGMWVRMHPELDKLANLYRRMYTDRKTEARRNKE